ncbi:hypothetical protein QYE76_042749 [Lolium multiflorum]|uniref:Transposon protein, putative, CACTA, En/Spm sub-class n=1 Tax=Lolium multiflorum TaxID=4521 RepID=A0AAD8WX97_LOLMU|nr:hypothetical protein QYE76_042749 [Lolium multiflorum]
MGEDEAEEEPIFDELIFDDPDDDLGRAILDAKMNCGNEKERLKLEKMLEDHNKLLYPNCENGQKKLGTTLELLQWKAENGTSDKGFEKLLKIIKKMLPGENVLPSTTYEAKKVVCPLGLEVQKIHACINDCILYRGEYENLNACPVCSALRYKIRRDDPSDVEGESTPRKRVPAKLYLLAKQPSLTISTFQGYEINGNTFYTFAQDKKSTNQNSGVRFDAEDGNGNKVTYYGYIEEIWELDYGPNFKVPLFRCKWFNLKDGVQVDPQYGMTTVDFKNLGLISANLIILSHGFHHISNPPGGGGALCLELPLPAGLPRPNRLLPSVGGVPVPPVPLGVAHEMTITNHYYFELTPEQRRNPQWHPDYNPTWESFFINRRERALARHEEGGPPPSNFNEAGRRLWWRGRTLQGVMAYRGPRLRYPQSQPTRAHPPTFDYRDPDASDDDDGDYDDYSGEYYRTRHEYD